MINSKPLGSVFNDKATLILRAMLKEPEKEWVVRDFVERFSMGVGWTAHVLRILRENGFLEGVTRGRSAFSKLRNGARLVEEWTRHYQARLNRFHLCYTHRKGILGDIVRYFKRGKLAGSYALTLHTGANVKTHYVADSNIYVYLNVEDFRKEYLALREKLDLKELKQGGNVHLIEPYYKNSVFFDVQKINGVRVVSDLQLYLDLCHFQPRGPEHANYLLRVLNERGERFV